MKDAPGMRGIRPRNKAGQLRDKRDDTHMGIIEKKYDRHFGCAATCSSAPS
jgi:hypothetical protein